MKNTIKMIFIILISTIFIISIPLYSSAFSFEDLVTSAKDFENEGNQGGGIAEKEPALQSLSNSVSNILLTIALGVTVISAAVMGINFAIQSVEDKAKIKESMVPWMIGILVSFGAYGIWKITMSVFYGFV